MADLTDDTRRAILLAATLLTGHKRRRFQAEMANTYCGGSARLAEPTSRITDFADLTDFTDGEVHVPGGPAASHSQRLADAVHNHGPRP